MLWTIIGFLILLWIVGLAFKVAGGIIHILLVLAGLLFLYRKIMNRNPG